MKISNLLASVLASLAVIASSALACDVNAMKDSAFIQAKKNGGLNIKISTPGGTQGLPLIVLYTLSMNGQPTYMLDIYQVDEDSCAMTLQGSSSIEFYQHIDHSIPGRPVYDNVPSDAPPLGTVGGKQNPLF